MLGSSVTTFIETMSFVKFYKINKKEFIIFK